MSAPARPPQYPSRDFLFGSLREFHQDKLRFLQDAHARYGDTVRLRMVTLTSLLVSHPKDVQRVLADNYKNYEKPFFYRVLQLVIGEGLITAQGAAWLQRRRAMQPGFHREQLQGMVATIARTTAHAASTLTGPVRVFDVMMELALQIAGRTLFSVDLAIDVPSFGAAFVEALAYMDYRMATPLALPSWIPTRRNRSFLRAAATLRQVSGDIIARRATQADAPNDLLQLLLAAKLEAKQVGDEVLTLLLAGHETTATTLCWVLYYLSQQPAHERAVRDELASVLSGRLPTHEDLQRLPYTEAVVKETMRLRPPVWLLQRRALADDMLGNYRVKKGDFIVMSPWVLHRRADVWRDPERFSPERFLGDAAIDKSSYIPFSAGPRKCIGDVMATLQTMTVLSTLLQRVRFTLPPGTDVRPDPQVTLRPSALVMDVVKI